MSLLSTSSTAAKWVLFSTAVLALAGCGASAPVDPQGSSSSEGACATPLVAVEPADVRPAGVMTLTGSDWLACADVSDGTAEAWEHVAVEWVQGESTQPLGEIPIVDGAFDEQVNVPDEASSGEAIVRFTVPDYVTEVTVTVAE